MRYHLRKSVTDDSIFNRALDKEEEAIREGRPFTIYNLIEICETLEDRKRSRSIIEDQKDFFDPDIMVHAMHVKPDPNQGKKISLRHQNSISSHIKVMR